MILGADNLINWYKLNDAPYWSIRASKEKSRANCIVKSRDIEQYSIKQGEEDLTKALSLLAHGTRYFIECKESLSSSSSIRETAFDLLDNHQAQTVSPSIGAVNHVSHDTLQNEIAKALEAYKEQQRIAELEKELKLLRAENKTLQQSPFEQRVTNVLSIIEPSIKKYMSGNNSQTPPVASIGSTGNQDQERLEIALEKWSNADADFVAVIEKIAALAVHDKSKYNMAKSML
jgi:hypothetical protein